MDIENLIIANKHLYIYFSYYIMKSIFNYYTIEMFI